MNKVRRITPTTAALLQLALCCALVALCALAKDAGAAHHPRTVATSCFSAKAWSADDADRPCTTITAPDDDHVRVIQGTAATEQAECIISTANIGDAHCHRVPRNRAAGIIYTPTTQDDRTPVLLGQGVNRGLAVVLTPPAEDGSVVVRVYQGGALLERCTLGNPVEERGAYNAGCVR